MKRAFTVIFSAVILMFSFAAPIAAGTDEDAGAARARGDYATALRLYRLAADQGDAHAQSTLGFMYDMGQGVQQDYAEAAKWFRLAADQGNADAQSMLGTLYAFGHGVAQSHAEAAKWLRLAADQGNAVAQYDLGVMCDDGQGTPQNHAEAAKWFRLAADQGFAFAQLRLGTLYALGRGVQQSYAEAAKWYRLAADQGDADAQYGLGVLYASGQGVLQNYVRAHIWFSLAGAQGYQNAVKELAKIAGLMTPAQVAEAQKQAAEWRPKTSDASQPETTLQSPPPKAPEEAATSGTAFFVSDNGAALTNAHVVEDCQHIRVNGGSARLLARDVKNDLALLATDQRPAQWSNWRISVRLGEDIVAYGFPLAGVLSSGGNIVTGNVTALAGLGDDSRFLQISAPVQPGNSGGPLFDRYGNVVGVVVSKLNALRTASATGDIPQNVNFAIKASVATAFLDAQRVTYSEGQGAGALSTPDIAVQAQALAVEVVCIQ